MCTPPDLVTFGGRDTWKDETAWNYEVGVKSKVLNGTGAVGVSGFYMDIHDLQSTVTAGSCSSRVVFNVPKARSVGDEDLGTLDLLSFGNNTIGAPLTARTFTYNPELPAYDTLNLRVGVRRNKWDVSFFVNNVTNEQALLSLDRERGTRARGLVQQGGLQ